MALAGTYGGLRRDRTLPSRNRRNRSGTARGQSRGHGVAARVCGLALRTSLTPKRGTPPGGYPAARCWRTRRASSFDGIGALPVLALGGRCGQPHLLAPVPDRNPRTECACQPVSFISSFSVVPSLRFSRSRIVLALLPSRAPAAFFAPLAAFLADVAFFAGVAFLVALPLAGGTWRPSRCCGRARSSSV